MPEEQLMLDLRRCRACGTLEPAARTFCANCGGDALSVERVNGDGVVVSWTIIRRPAKAFEAFGEIPIALVRLDAGATITGRFAPGSDILPVGTRVALRALDHDGVPMFG